MPSWEHVNKQLEKDLGGVLPPRAIRTSEPMSAHTTFKIGGPADLFLLPESRVQLRETLRLCHQHQAPLLIIGEGSNLLVRDGGIRGVVVKMGENLSDLRVWGQEIWVEAGHSMKSLAQEAAREGLSGLEFGCGIPGTIGGAVFMNAGAYGGEISKVIREVFAVDQAGEQRVFSHEELEFSYRRSRLQREGWVAVEIRMQLSERPRGEIYAAMEEYTQMRREKQPLEWPSAGSIFKRPPGHYTGPLIEGAGLKGFQIGGAQVSVKHAGFIINAGGARAADVLGLIAHIQAVIKEKYGVELETEVRVVGEDPVDRAP